MFLKVHCLGQYFLQSTKPHPGRIIRRHGLSYHLHAELVLKLNYDKTELLIITTREREKLSKISDISIKVGDQSVFQSDDPPRNLGMIFDSTTIWNHLPLSVKQAPSIEYFKARQKTYLSEKSFWSFICVFPWPVHNEHYTTLLGIMSRYTYEISAI